MLQSLQAPAVPLPHLLPLQWLLRLNNRGPTRVAKTLEADNLAHGHGQARAYQGLPQPIDLDSKPNSGAIIGWVTSGAIIDESE